MAFVTGSVAEPGPLDGSGLGGMRRRGEQAMYLVIYLFALIYLAGMVWMESGFVTALSLIGLGIAGLVAWWLLYHFIGIVLYILSGWPGPYR